MNRVSRTLAIAALALPMAMGVLWAGEEEASGAGDTPDYLRQPGIVTEITGTDTHFRFDGRSKIRATLGVEAFHDDNVFLNVPGLEQDDFVWELLPSVFFESSRPEDLKPHYMTVGYDPQLLRYSDFGGEIDADNHRGFAEWRYLGARIEAELRHRSAQFSGSQRELADALFGGADADLGRRTSGDRHLTNLTSDIGLGGASWLDLEGYRFRRVFDESEDTLPVSEEHWGEAILMHELSPKTRAGAGPRFGKVEVDGAPDHDYTQGLIRLGYYPSRKTEIDLDAGADFRRYDGSAPADDLDTPVFEGRFLWKATPTTTVIAEGFRNVSYSVAGDSITRTGIRATLRQRITRELAYTLRGGYEVREYDPSTTASTLVREDDYTFLVNRLDYRFGDRGLVGVFHELRKNESSLVTNTFDRNQVGFRVFVHF